MGPYGNCENFRPWSACAVRAGWPRWKLFAIGRFSRVLSDNSTKLNCHFEIIEPYGPVLASFLFLSFYLGVPLRSLLAWWVTYKIENWTSKQMMYGIVNCIWLSLNLKPSGRVPRYVAYLTHEWSGGFVFDTGSRSNFPSGDVLSLRVCLWKVAKHCGGKREWLVLVFSYFSISLIWERGPRSLKLFIATIIRFK